MALVSFFTPQWHGTCALRFWLLWEALSSPHKRPATNEMEMQFCFVKGLNTKHLYHWWFLSFVVVISFLRPRELNEELGKYGVLLHKMLTKRRGRSAFLLFSPHLRALSYCLPPKFFVHLSSDWEKNDCCTSYVDTMR